MRADNTDITGAESLQNNKKLCSVSGSTPAQRIKDKYPGVQLQQYDTYSACIEALKNGAIDAVTTDEVILAGYAAQSPGAFKIVGEPFSEEKYGIGLKKGDTELQTKINDAIAKMEQDGAWKAAWDKNLGPAGIAAPGAAADRPDLSGSPPGTDVEIFTEYRGQIFEAFWTTIQLTVFSAIGALILGTALAAMRLAPVPMLNWIGTTYVNVVRNTPLTLIILFCSFGLSQTLGITLVDPKSLTSIEDSNFRLAVLGLTVYTAAFVCETVRSGVNTVPLGQAEAARSLGLTFSQNLRIDPAAAGFSRRHHSAGLGADRVDEEHHDRVGDRRRRGGAADEGDDREHRGAADGRNDLRARLRHPDAADGVVLRLAG